MTITDLWRTATTAAAEHGNILLGALALTVLVVGVAAYRAHRKNRLYRWLSPLAWIAAFGFSAEGMWMVATQKAHVPPVVAVGVFFVAEAFQLASMTHASRRYALDGHPGKHGRAVWIIAVAAGTVVAFAAHNMPEALLRFLIPLGAALLWWNTLTDAGMTRPQSRWRWTPSRLLEWLGAVEPDVDRDLADVVRARQVTAMVTARLGWEADGRLRGWHGRRLRNLAKTADDAIVSEVADRVGRVLRIVELTVPTPEVPVVEVPEVPAEVPVSAAPEVPAAPSARPSAGTSGRKVTRKKPEPRPRRSADETRKLAAELAASKPTLTQEQIAAQLRISSRRLREVLSPAPAAEPAKSNGHAVPDLMPTGGTS